MRYYVAGEQPVPKVLMLALESLSGDPSFFQRVEARIRVEAVCKCYGFEVATYLSTGDGPHEVLAGYSVGNCEACADGRTRGSRQTRAAHQQHRALPAVAKAREERLSALRAEDRQAKLPPLKPGPRTTNKCLTLLVGILGYAVEHGLASRNVAADMDKLPAAKGEGEIVEQNVLTPAELRKLLDAAADPWEMPVAPRRVLRAGNQELEAHGGATRRARVGAQALAPALPEGRA
jgi:hypothetical protein